VYQYLTYVEMMHMKQIVDSFLTKDLVEDASLIALMMGWKRFDVRLHVKRCARLSN